MTTPDWIVASQDRIDRARNRLQWQRRLLSSATDPTMRRISGRMIATLEEVVTTLEATHVLLLQRATQKRGGPEEPGWDE